MNRCLVNREEALCATLDVEQSLGAYLIKRGVGPVLFRIRRQAVSVNDKETLCEGVLFHDRSHLSVASSERGDQSVI